MAYVVMDGPADAAAETVAAVAAARALVEERLARAGAGASLLLVDLDRFHDVNAAVGHRAGDEVLAEAGRRIAAALEGAALLAHLGADAFAIVPTAPGEAAALRCVAEVQASLAPPVRVGGHTTYLSASIGIAVAGSEPIPDALLRDAGDAVRRAKSLGGNRTEVADPRQARRRGERVRLEAELREALEEGRLEMLYQPVVALDDGRILAMEALLRWHHPRRGTLAPGDFLFVAEQSGLIAEVGRWALAEACRQAALWAADPELAAAAIAVNVSGRQLAQPGFADEVRAGLERSALPAERLWLEVTETGLLEHASVPAAAVQRLRDAGVRVALDDFGTGASALRSLRGLPIQTLKLDGLLVAELLDGDGRRSARLLRAIVELAAALDLEVIAEGVETEEQLRTLIGLGCTAAQGYLLCPPVAAAAASELLRDGLPAAARATLARAVSARRSVAAPSGPPAEPGTATAAALAEDGPALSLSQACDALGVSISTLRRWADSGRIHAVRTAGGHRRFPASEIRRLNLARVSGTPATVAPVPPPADAAPAAADVLRARASDIADLAAAALYRGARSGWFAGDGAARPVRAFLAGVASGAVRGDYAEATAACERLMTVATMAGTTLLERDGFLERTFELILRAMTSVSAPREQMVTMQRLARALRQRALDAG